MDSPTGSGCRREFQFATFGSLAKLGAKGRPEFGYGRVIHDDCPRRPYFDNGRFAQRYGDEGSPPNTGSAFRDVDAHPFRSIPGDPSSDNPPTQDGTQHPGGLLRWYFAAVWNERDYQDLWENYLTPSFKARPNAGGYEGYAAWWSSVQRVDVNSVTVLENDGTNAWVRVNVTFTMMDGRVIANQEYDYDLYFDAARQTWMFDYRP